MPHKYQVSTSREKSSDKSTLFFTGSSSNIFYLPFSVSGFFLLILGELNTYCYNTLIVLTLSILFILLLYSLQIRHMGVKKLKIIFSKYPLTHQGSFVTNRYFEES